MKVLIIGQCQGGNAKIWRDFLETYDGFTLTHYVCRNSCQSDFFIRNKNKHVFRFYNFFAASPFLHKIWIKLVTIAVLPVFIKLMDALYKYDIIHFQGNYEPEFNLRLMNNTKAKAVITIYGSDFYQRFKNGDDRYRLAFERTISKADHVLFNFEKSKQDFLKEIYIPDKCSVGCMGVNDFWSKRVIEVDKKEGLVTRFLSARGMYAYNNVDLLVDAFIQLYANNPAFELYLVNGYGWDEQVKERIMRKVKNISNIYTAVGKWISDDDLKNFYDLCDYNFCIGSTDQLSVSIIYGFMHNTLNILSPLDNYKELEDLHFQSHYFLNNLSSESICEVLQNLPNRNLRLLESDRTRANEIFLFSKRFENTKNVFDSLINCKI